jgi:hypothetical protein
MTPDLFTFMSTLFYEKSSSFLTTLSSHLLSLPPSTSTTTLAPLSTAAMESLEADLEASRLALKTLRRLLVNGFPERRLRDAESGVPPVNEYEEAVVRFLFVYTVII